MTSAPEPATRATGRLWPPYDIHDYEQLPDDGNRYEIIEGDLYMTPAPRTVHQIVSRNLLLAIHRWAREHATGEVLSAPFDVELGLHDLVQPDLLFLSAARKRLLTDRRLMGAPDLVVEILSSSTSARDLGVKRRAYERYGVREYWVADPDRRTLTVYARDPESRALVSTSGCGLGDVLTTPLLEGFSVSLDEVFDLPELAGDEG